MHTKTPTTEAFTRRIANRRMRGNPLGNQMRVRRLALFFSGLSFSHFGCSHEKAGRPRYDTHVAVEPIDARMTTRGVPCVV